MFRSIVVGTDGSDTARKAVDEAIDLAKSVGAAPVPGLGLRAGAAVAPARGGAAGARGPAVDGQPARGRRRDALSDAADIVREAGVEVETFAREGDPADAILDVAEERNADLIVVGNKGMTGARRFLLGSVPNKVSHHAPCSVLIIRTTRARGRGPGRLRDRDRRVGRRARRPAGPRRSAGPCRAGRGRARSTRAGARSRPASGSGRAGRRRSTSAAVADTCGAAIEVPM